MGLEDLIKKGEVPQYGPEYEKEIRLALNELNNLIDKYDVLGEDIKSLATGWSDHVNAVLHKSGQITVPKVIREAKSINKEDEVDVTGYVTAGDGEVLWGFQFRQTVNSNGSVAVPKDIRKNIRDSNASNIVVRFRKRSYIVRVMKNDMDSVAIFTKEKIHFDDEGQEFKKEKMGYVVCAEESEEGSYREVQGFNENEEESAFDFAFGLRAGLES